MEDCWTFCVEAYPDVLAAVDLNDRGECFCQDACTCLDTRDGIEAQLMTTADIAYLPDACPGYNDCVGCVDADDGDDKGTRREVELLVFAMAATVVVCCCFAAAMLAVAARIIRRKPLAEPRPPRATAVEWPNVPHEAVVVL